MRAYLIIGMALCLAIGCSTSPVKAPLRLSIGDQAPLFVLPDLFTSEEVSVGKLFYENNATVLVFWSMACPVCREALIEIDDLYKSYRDKVVAFIAINFDIENIQGVRGFIKGENLAMRMVWDRGGAVTKSYKAYDYTFSLFVVGRDGKLLMVQYDHSPDLKTRVQNLLDRIIAGR